MAITANIVKPTTIINVVRPVLYTAFPKGVLGLTASAVICCSRSCRNSIFPFCMFSGVDYEC